MPIVALLLLAGCDYNEKNFDGLEDITQPENVTSVDYTLTTADYAAIASNKTNLAIARAVSKDDSIALVNLKTTLQFTSTITPDKYLPAFLATKYFTASPTSVARVTFNYQGGSTEVLKSYTAIPYIGLEKNEDYIPFYGEGYYAPYLNAATVQQIGTKLLAPKYPDAKDGNVVMVGYNYNETAVPQQIEAPVENYNFNSLASGDVTSISGWFLKTTAKSWLVGSYKGNSYIQYSASGTEGECQAWLITPKVKIEGEDKNLGFDITIGRFDADCLSILISTDFDGKDVTKAKWDDITSAYAPTPDDKRPDGYGKAVATKVSLAAYAGKTIRVAFKYVGDGANKKTTTYQIDNVVVGKDIPKAVTTTPQFKLFSFGSKKWSEYVNKPGSKMYCPTWEDYALMGQPGTNMYFTNTVRPENYIPEYLTRQGNYPQNGDAVAVIYRFYNYDKAISAQAKGYTFSSTTGKWEVMQETRQYAFDGTVWKYDPSLTITLSTDKGDKVTSAFYQSITDWVKANKGAEYVTTFGNNDYYYGGSAYNNNFDFRLSAWRGQNAKDYGEMSDDNLKALMMKRLAEAFIPGLESQYPKAAPSEGVNVIYTIKFAIYDGTATTSWNIAYKVTEVGKFAYVEGSLKEVK